jgi:glucose/arabinose dehydrogenase
MFKYCSVLLSMSILLSCTPTTKEADSDSIEAVQEEGLPLSRIKLPAGFKISVFAEVPNARSLAMTPDGNTIFVGNRNEDKVYAVRDTDGDGKADKVWVLAEGLKMPNGVAFRGGDLFVAEISRILKFPNILDQLDNPPAPEVVYDQFPTERHHGWKFIAFGPDGLLYVPVGAPCNICESDDEIFASITRIDVDAKVIKPEVFASGVRNTVGFTWHPETSELWFTDNGRDMMGDNFPPCELNHAPRKGMHFGYPYCHGGDIADPEFGGKFPCTNFVPPVQKLGPHVAPLGIRFYTGDMFPSSYKNQLIFAEHGSWNRSQKIGYRLMMVTLDGNKATSYVPFAEGWLDDDTQTAFGRPVDVMVLPDGSLLVSDDFAHVIYRIHYEG